MSLNFFCAQGTASVQTWKKRGEGKESLQRHFPSRCMNGCNGWLSVCSLTSFESLPTDKILNSKMPQMDCNNNYNIYHFLQLDTLHYAWAKLVTEKSMIKRRLQKGWIWSWHQVCHIISKASTTTDQPVHHLEVFHCLRLHSSIQ